MDEEVVDSDVAGATADTLNWSMSAISCGEENKNHYVVTPSDLSPASSEASLDNVNGSICRITTCFNLRNTFHKLLHHLTRLHVPCIT